MEITVTTPLDALPDCFAVIDMDTGTVVGTNLRLVNFAALPPETEEEVLSSDEAAYQLGKEKGKVLLTLDTFPV